MHSSNPKGSKRGLVLLLGLGLSLALWIWSPWAGGEAPEPMLAPGPLTGTEAAAGAEPELAQAAPDEDSPERIEQPTAATVPEAVVDSEHDPRDLVVRVVDLRGEPVDDVPMCLFVAQGDEEAQAQIQDVRATGNPVKNGRGRSLSPPAGTVIWAEDEGMVRNLWGFHDKGETFPGRFWVGPMLGPEVADPAAVRIELSTASWPTMPVELVLGDATVAAVGPLIVEVHHADGQPAPDMPVTLFGIPTDQNFGSLGELGEATSGPDGVARIPRFTLLRYIGFLSTVSDGEARAGELFDLFVAASPDLPLTLNPRVPVPGDADAGQRVRLDLPPLGRLVGVAVDQDGAPLALGEEQGAGIGYGLRWTTAPQPPKNRERSEQLRSRTGQARFDLGPVGLGMELEAWAWDERISRPRPSVTFAGPTAAGETVEVRFVFEAPHTELAWQVLDVDGEPVRSAALSYVLRRPDEPLDPGSNAQRKRHWRGIETDAQGILSWTTQPYYLSGEWVLELQHVLDDGTTWASAPLPAAMPEATPASDADQPSVADMGSLQLSTQPLPELAQLPEVLLAEGHVVDEAGEPLRRVNLHLRGTEDSDLWGNETTDREGHFEFRTTKPVGPFRVSSYLEGYQSWGSEELQPGSAGLVVELKRGGAIVGQLERQAALSSDYPEIRAWVGDARGEARRSPGEFRIDGLPTGTAELEITTAECGFVLLHVEGIEVVAGEETADPRLADLDLADLAHLQPLRFEGQDGKPLDTKYVYVRLPNGKSGSVKLNTRAGCKVLIPRDVTLFGVTAGGGGVIELTPSDDEQTIRF